MCPRLPAGILLFLAISNALLLVENKTAQTILAPSANQEGPTEAGLEEEFRQARDKLRLSPEFTGTDAESHIRFAETLHHRGDLTGAAEEYQAAIRLNSELTEAYRGLGVVLIDRHDWMGAVKALNITTRRRPDDAEAFYWLGRALMAQGDWTAASEALATAIRLKPDDAEAYVDLGLMHMVQDNPTAAEQALRLAVKLKPDNADAHNLLETVLTHQQEPQYLVREAHRMLDTMFARE